MRSAVRSDKTPSVYLTHFPLGGKRERRKIETSRSVHPTCPSYPPVFNLRVSDLSFGSDLSLQLYFEVGEGKYPIFKSLSQIDCRYLKKSVNYNALVLYIIKKSSFIHYNCLKDEEPEFKTGIVTYSKQFIFGKGSLLHIPIPRPMYGFHG